MGGLNYEVIKSGDYKYALLEHFWGWVLIKITYIVKTWQGKYGLYIWFIKMVIGLYRFPID